MLYSPNLHKERENVGGTVTTILGVLCTIYAINKKVFILARSFASYFKPLLISVNISGAILILKIVCMNQ